MQKESERFERLMSDYLSGNLNRENERILLEYIRSDEIYRSRYSEMAKLYAISQIPHFEKRKADNYQDVLLRISSVDSRKKNRHIGFRIRHIAALFLLLLTTGISSYYLYHDLTRTPDSLLVYETIVPLGSQTKVILPDGSAAWLNSGSVLKYNQSFGKQERAVFLTGEGYFDVAKDTKRPFLVKTDELDIRVLGTKFNVCSYPEDEKVEVDLLAGQVTVGESFSEKTTVLKPDNKAVFNKRNKEMRVFVSDAHKAVRWTMGKLSFVNAFIPDIIKDIERKYNVRIFIESEQMKTERFSGSIDLSLPLYEILEYVDVDRKYKIIQDANSIRIRDK